MKHPFSFDLNLTFVQYYTLVSFIVFLFLCLYTYSKVGC